MTRFSQRYGYTLLDKAIVRGCMPKEIENSLCSAFDILKKQLIYKESFNYYYTDKYKDLEKYLWLNFLNKRYSDFEYGNGYNIVATKILNGYYQGFEEWFLKLDMLEMAIQYLHNKYKDSQKFNKLTDNICQFINNEFERHCYAYRIINLRVVEITSEIEIDAIETAFFDINDSVKTHLSNAITALAQRPDGDYTNSIKESISAVEALCRELTGELTLGKAIKAFEKKGIISLPEVMKDGLEKMYAYTNQPSTGIRHALMDSQGNFMPAVDEARYMLVVCSAFINYIRSKCVP